MAVISWFIEVLLSYPHVYPHIKYLYLFGRISRSNATRQMNEVYLPFDLMR